MTASTTLRSLTVLLLATLPALAAPAGKIALESARDGNLEIYVTEPDGSGPVRLTADPAADRSPAWSPDGTRIAFHSARGGNVDLYVMNADGTGVTRLTSDPAAEIQPAWSPDGTRIAYARFVPTEGTYDVWIMNADGSGAENWTQDPGDDQQPAWSPDGQLILFRSDRTGDQELWVGPALGSGVDSSILSNEPFFQDTDPAWSPDGTRIAFASDRGDGQFRLYVMGADGSSPVAVEGTVPGDAAPAWTRDGLALVFARAAGGATDLYQVPVDGSAAPTPLVVGPGDDAAPDVGAPVEPPPPPPENQPPVADAGPDQQAPCASAEGATVTLDGRGSTDPEDRIVHYEWFEGAVPLGSGALRVVTLGPGAHAITLRVTDEGGLSDTDGTVVTVTDPASPSLSATVSPSVLSPPDHRMVEVTATVTATGGLCTPAPAWVLASVTSNEPDDAPGVGDGSTYGDVAGAETGTPDTAVLLRAERNGTGSGRVYTLTWRIEDGPGAGNTTSATVVVPRGNDDPVYPDRTRTRKR